MHPSRLSFLAVKHEQQRAVISLDVRPDETRVALECGHTVTIAPHFDARHRSSYGCCACGENFVRTSPKYASEFV